MVKTDTRERLSRTAASTDEAEKVLRIFTDHFKLAASNMGKLEAALHTGYTAASNYLAAHREGERSKGGVSEVK